MLPPWLLAFTVLGCAMKAAREQLLSTDSLSCEPCVLYYQPSQQDAPGDGKSAMRVIQLSLV